MTDNPTPNTPGYRQNRKKRKSTKRKIFLLLLKHGILAGIAFICAGVFIMITMDRIVMPIALKSGKNINAPSLIGKTVDEAREIIRNERLVLSADSLEYNNDFSENTILFQYPAAGTVTKPGRTLKVIVSLGARPINMPDLTGEPRRDAELKVKALGLTLLRFEWVHSNDYVRTIVARQFPEGGQEIPENAEVILYISDGQPETDVIMPHLIELGLSTVMDTLQFYNFDIENVNIQYEDAPELMPETVIDQHPDPGTPTNTEAVVDLIVSTPQ